MLSEIFSFFAKSASKYKILCYTLNINLNQSTTMNAALSTLSQHGISVAGSCALVAGDLPFSSFSFAIVSGIEYRVS